MKKQDEIPFYEAYKECPKCGDAPFVSSWFEDGNDWICKCGYVWEIDSWDSVYSEALDESWPTDIHIRFLRESK